MKLPALFTILILISAGCDQPESIVRNPVVHEKAHVTKPDMAIIKSKQHDTISIAAVGDIMLGSAYPDSSKLPPDSAKGSFKRALPYFKGSDIVFGNLEGTLLDSGMPATYKKKLTTAFLFRMPTPYAQVLKDAGFNLLSVANNHITDFGDNGCLSTMQTLQKYNIRYAGLESCPTTIFEQNGIKYGFCAFAPNAHTLSLLQTERAVRIIHQLKQQCDVVIVSFHGGAEGTAYEHVPHKMESYLGAKRGDVNAFAHAAIDAGADVIFGNGPHVSRAMEMYKNRLIAYSLGNFCTYKSVSVMGVCGMAPLLKVYLNKKGEFLSGRIISFKQTHENGLMPDTLNRVVNRIKMLTQADFPQSGLVIDEKGLITTQTKD